MKIFSNSDLPFDNNMKKVWDDNGYLIIKDFYSNDECDSLRDRASLLVKKFDPQSVKSIFDTKNQNENEEND